jgi:hypothetical protein
LSGKKFEITRHADACEKFAFTPPSITYSSVIKYLEFNVWRDFSSGLPPLGQDSIVLMYDFSQQAVALLGRIAVAAALWFAAPQEFGETFSECEVIAVARVETSVVVEPSRQCLCHAQLHYGSHTPGRCPGLTAFSGQDGRQLSPDLFAPLRC